MGESVGGEVGEVPPGSRQGMSGSAAPALANPGTHPCQAQLFSICSVPPQSCMYLAQLSQSRSHEYEADQLALELGGGAGMDKRVEVGRLGGWGRLAQGAPGVAVGGNVISGACACGSSAPGG